LVFQRFARLDAARNKDAGGTGLGLAIARQTAETHGGTLRIEDSDRGARFVLRLPRYQEASLA
ncbi:ATP-binding protein, partial [Planotetraspora thailandica]|uniref:ATP-binding protein n=1 Tax=Planotetraspora thailandica TaxID=487172 RepID=UPI0035E4C18A